MLFRSPISLTPTEFRMLTRLCQQPNQVVSARALLDDGEAYGLSDQDARSIAKVHVRHLRQKIEPFANGAVQIATIRGAGYGLRVSPEQSVGPTF